MSIVNTPRESEAMTVIDLAKMRRKRDASRKEDQEAPRTKRKPKPDDTHGIEWDNLIGYEGTDDTIGLPHEGVEYVSEKAALMWIEGDKYWVPFSQIADADSEALIITEWWWDKAEPVED